MILVKPVTAGLVSIFCYDYVKINFFWLVGVFDHWMLPVVGGYSSFVMQGLLRYSGCYEMPGSGPLA